MIFLLWLQSFVRSPGFASGLTVHGLLATCNKQIEKKLIRFTDTVNSQWTNEGNLIPSSFFSFFVCGRCLCPSARVNDTRQVDGRKAPLFQADYNNATPIKLFRFQGI